MKTCLCTLQLLARNKHFAFIVLVYFLLLIFLFKVFPPTFREPPPPPLELFDLDEAFSSERSQLARMANKCLQPASTKFEQGDGRQLENELEYFVRECGRVVRLSRAAPTDDGPAGKAILHQLAAQLATFKKIAPKD